MNQQQSYRLSILGAGAWGSALARVVKQAGGTPLLWDRSGSSLNPNLNVTSDLKEVLAYSNVWLCVVPAQAVRGVLKTIITNVPPKERERKTLILASKGIEQETGYLLSEIVTQTCPELSLGAISGPNLAHEVAQGLPAAATLAVPQQKIGNALKSYLSGPTFEIELTQDIIGVQLGGALKNVIAIACGYLYGQQAGENAVATLLTQGLQEMVVLGKALGADPLTFLGFSGVGDLVLTCKSQQSRNTAFGIALGQGLSPEAAKAAMGNKLVEGAMTAFSVSLRAKQLNVAVPLTRWVCALLNGEKPPFADLLRPQEQR